MLHPKLPGITLIEILLVIGLFTLLAGLSAPVVQQFQSRQSLQSANAAVVQQWRRAGWLARHRSRGDSWGVKVLTDRVVLFKGGSYASRDASFDEQYDILSNISVSGSVMEVIFAPLTGYPNTTGSLTLSGGNQDYSPSINRLGVVDY